MTRDLVYTGGLIAGVIILLVILVLVLQNIFSVAVMVAIGCGIGYAADSLFSSRHSKGMMGAAVLGMAGALVGNLFLTPILRAIIGSTGPSLANVSLLPSFLGATLLGWLMRTRTTLDRVKALDDYKASGDSSDPLLMTQLAEYRIVRFLGSGAYSRVYTGLPDKSLRETEGVAIKIFTESALASDGFIERLKREVELCQSLDHPNIVRVFTSGEQNGLHYMVMELVEGKTLAGRMKAGRLSLREAVDLTIDMASAMAHAHAKGVIHRDIKPENVVVSKSGPKIMDFGLARLEGTSSLTQSGSAIGTPHYMAPEQVLGEKKLDGRCDQYALGGVAFEMLTGEKLFDGDQAVLVLMKHIEEKPRNVCDMYPDIPQALGQIVMRMLAKKADDRYPNMEAVVEELSKLGSLKEASEKMAKFIEKAAQPPAPVKAAPKTLPAVQHDVKPPATAPTIQSAPPAPAPAIASSQPVAPAVIPAATVAAAAAVSEVAEPPRVRGGFERESGTLDVPKAPKPPAGYTPPASPSIPLLRAPAGSTQVVPAPLKPPAAPSAAPAAQTWKAPTAAAPAPAAPIAVQSAGATQMMSALTPSAPAAPTTTPPAPSLGAPVTPPAVPLGTPAATQAMPALGAPAPAAPQGMSLGTPLPTKKPEAPASPLGIRKVAPEPPPPPPTMRRPVEPPAPGPGLRKGFEASMPSPKAPEAETP